MPRNYHSESRVSRSRVRLSCVCEGAKEVFVSGTFNGWNTRALRMHLESSKEWAADIDLIPGTYQYKFLVDGEWCCEPGCDSRNPACEKCVPNPFGTMNRRLEVS